MSDTELDTTLCTECQTPIETPKPTFHCGGMLALVPAALCKDCLAKAKTTYLTEQFNQAHVLPCPYKVQWRPKR